MKVFNMTQHKLQLTQIAQAEQMGYEFIDSSVLEELKKQLSNLKGDEDLTALSKAVIEASIEADCSLIFPIGSPLFYMIFATEVAKRPVELLFSHTLRECIETVQADGSVQKKMVFNHVGYHVFNKGETQYFPL